MKEVVKLMDYRPDIKIVDATLRDGGLVNNFRFTDEFVKDLYQTNIKAGVDVMEFGYKADKEMFDVKDFGKWKFCDDEDIRAVVGDNNTDLKIAVMADVGRCNYKQDIKPRAESPVDVIRVATYINQIPAAVDVIEDAVAKGYEVTCNIMAISNAQEAVPGADSAYRGALRGVRCKVRQEARNTRAQQPAARVCKYGRGGGRRR